MTRLRGVMLCGAVLALPVAANASEKRLSADVDASAGYSNNPFSTTGSDTGSPFVEFNVKPQFAIVNERSVFTATAAAQVQQYLRRYSTTDSYRAGLDYRGTPIEHLTTHLNANFVSSIVGSANNFSGVIDPLQPVDTTDPDVSGDIGLYGTRARRRTINVGGDVSAALTARDQVTASAFFLDSGYSGAQTIVNTTNYTGSGGSLGYSRQINSHTQVGLRGSVSHYDYAGAGSDTTVYSVQPTLTAKVNAFWSLSGSAGVSFVERPGSSLSKSFSGDLSLCRTGGVRATACLSARRAVLPTGLFGTQTTTTLGGSYRYRLSEHGTLGFTADYINTARPTVALTNGNEYARGTVSYERQLRERVRFTSSAHYRKIFGGALGRASDFGAQVGLAVRLGDIR